MRVVAGRDPSVAAFVASHAPLDPPDFGEYMTLAILNAAGCLVAGVVYSDYRPRYGTVQLAGASVSPQAASPQTARVVLAFAFEQLGVQKIWTQSGLSNKRALRLLKFYGFTQEAVLGHEYGNEHCVRMRLFRRDWERRNGLALRAA